MERVADDGGIDRAVGEREPLRDALEHFGARDLRGQHRPHRRRRLDRDQRADASGEEARQLAGARGEVEDTAAARQPELLDQPRHELRRVAGAPALVDQRRLLVGSEPSSRELVHAAGG